MLATSSTGRRGALSPWTVSPIDQEPDLREVRLVPIQDADAGAPIQKLPVLAAAAEDPVDGGAEEDWKGEGPLQIRDLFADEQCTRSILDFLHTTNVGEEPMELDGAKEEAQSEDWDREREVGSDEEWEDSGQECCSRAAARREGEDRRAHEPEEDNGAYGEVEDI